MSKPPSSEPSWLAQGFEHIWLPYAQMKTMTRPVAVKATSGTRIVLDDGRELIDGISSWWTAVHGYNHPALIAAARAQLERMPHVMLGGLANEPAYRLAAKLAAMGLTVAPAGAQEFAHAVEEQRRQVHEIASIIGLTPSSGSGPR